jgi:hypothetical protein
MWYIRWGQVILIRVEEEVRRLYADVPQTIAIKEAELAAEERKIANFIEFVGEGRGSRQLAAALLESERRADQLKNELEGLRKNRATVFQAPPLPWIEERAARLQEVLERRTERSALLLRKLLGTIRLDPCRPEVGRPYYRALTKLQAVALLEHEGETGQEAGSTSLQWWRRRESNPTGAPTLTL